MLGAKKGVCRGSDKRAEIPRQDCEEEEEEDEPPTAGEITLLLNGFHSLVYPNC